MRTGNIIENLFSSSETPSRYQTGVVRYIGAQTKMCRSGREAAKVLILSKKLEKIDSTRLDTDDDEEADKAPVTKLVTQEMMHAFDSARVSSRAADRVESLPQGMNCAVDIGTRPFVVVPVRLRRTFESPTTVKTERSPIFLEQLINDAVVDDAGRGM